MFVERFYKVKFRDYVTSIDADNYIRIVALLAKGSNFLEFNDIYGTNLYFAASGFEGMWLSTPEIRAEYKAQSKALDEEEGKTSWD